MTRWGLLGGLLLIVGCEQKRDVAEVPESPPAVDQRDVNAPTPDASVTPASDAQLSTEPKARCLEAYGAQQVQLMPLEGDVGVRGSRFRFGAEEDALVYETEWVGDLNEDGVKDLVARRDTNGARQVRMVLIGCGQRHALGWAGISSQIEVLDDETEIDDVAWRNLRIHSDGGARAMAFSGDKYRPAR